MPPHEGSRRRTLWVTGAALVVIVVGVVVAISNDRRPAIISESCVASANGESQVLAPDQAGNAALITAVAVRRGMPARAATIAIATAIQESKLRNIDYGDRDSIGLFQQRPSQGWGTVEEILDPLYSTNAFYDVLEAIDGYESMQITEAAQRVQRSGFPEAYADHEPEGRAFASALTGHSPAALTCRLRPSAATDTEEPADGGLTPRAGEVLSAAEDAFGDLSADPGADDGATVRFDLQGGESARKGWALAQWAVASAEGLDVVAVETDGKRWERGPDGAWVASDAAPDAGTVYVTVANGQ
jgi:hypothetical protein